MHLVCSTHKFRARLDYTIFQSTKSSQEQLKRFMHITMKIMFKMLCISAHTHLHLPPCVRVLPWNSSCASLNREDEKAQSLASSIIRNRKILVSVM